MGVKRRVLGQFLAYLGKNERRERKEGKVSEGSEVCEEYEVSEEPILVKRREIFSFVRLCAKCYTLFMYKALVKRDNTEIIILDSKWLRIINQLRYYGHQDFLVCQGYKQSVIIRAGEQKRAHFAHKHLGSCDYADESEILRNACAVLYEWLVSKFRGCRND